MATPPYPPITILNVDDHEINRYTKTRLLQQVGFEVKEADSGAQALQVIAQEKPSLVLLDVGLPDINGLEVCRRIKSDPTLALTLVLQISASWISSTDRVQGLEGGADAYLVEPVEPTELIATIRALLRLRQAEVALQAQHSFLRQVIDLNPNLIFAKDRQGRFTLVNQAVAEVYGTTVEGLLGKTDADFTATPAEVEHFQTDDLAVMDSLQEKFIPEETITDTSGQTRWLQTIKRPIIGADGLAHQILGVATDITRRKQDQAALTRLNETLEQRVYERTGLMQLLQEVSTAANEAERVETALQFALDRICAYTGWPVGHVYWLNRENLSQLISSRLWHLDEPERYEAFRQVSEVIHFEVGKGLPGQILATGEVTWVSNVTDPSNFPRAKVAAKVGLQAGFGFPLWVSQEIVAVMEFYSPETSEPDGSFLEAITQIGTQLGRVVERRRAEKRIKESEQQLLEAQQIAHLGSWTWDIEPNRVSWSDELYRIYGLEPQSVAIDYEGFLTRVYDEDRETVANRVTAAYETGQPFDFEHRVVRADGTIRIVRAQGKVLPDEAGRPYKMVGTAQDITARKRMEDELRSLTVTLEQRVVERTAQLEQANQVLAEEIKERQQIELALQANEKQLRLIADAAPSLISYVDTEQRYRFNNRTYQTWFGTSQADLTGRHLRDVLGETAYQALQPQLEAVLAGEDVHFEQLIPYGSGGARYVQAHYVPDFDEAGQLRGFVVLVNDISERKRAELAANFLAEAGKVLTSSLDPLTQLSNIAWLAVPNLADWCSVDLYDEDWKVRHVAVAHVDPAKVALADEVQRRYPPRREELIKGEQPWQQGQSQLYPEITDDLLEAGAQDAEHYQILRSLTLKSAMVVPLVARERVLGIMAFFWAESGRRYDEQDLALAEELARRAAIALENARAYQAEQQARQAAEEAAARIASLQNITAAFSEALTSTNVARVVMEHGLTVLGATAGTVALLNEAGAMLETIDYMGYSAEAVQKWQSYPVTAAAPIPEAVRTGQPIFIGTEEELAARYPGLRAQSNTSYPALVGLPLAVKGRVLGGIGLSFAEPQAFTLEDRAFILALAQQCAQALERARLYEVEQRARVEAEANQQRLAMLAEMRERNRLAQELHDTVAQALSYLNIKIGITDNLLNSNKIKDVQANIHELKQVIGETYTDVREEIFNLRAKVISNLSFMEIINRYIDKYRRFYNLDIQVIQEADPGLFDFPPEVSSQLVRTIQEALINIRKHARVNRAIIRLGQENGLVRISVEDEGRGFDPVKVKEKTSSFGLQIMQERVESVGGSLEIDTTPQQGTRIILRYQK